MAKVLNIITHRKMQIKATVKYHYAAIKMAKIKMID